ncbi:MAG: LysM peptidoglycan-binding domain-containing protein [Deltaproteobacteria bacterium]|nr:LysM peptidoglycan-binding domain-containing protein [Deltaproteobacteria bacterium]
MKKIIIAFVGLLVLGASPMLLASEIIHTVKEGDTLWDISIKYLNTPWDWPIVWAKNQDITNPHLIYPGDKVIIKRQGKTVEIVVAQAEKPSPPKVYSPKEFVEQKEKTIVVSPGYSTLIYTKTPLRGTGKIIENETIGSLATLEDTILAKMSSDVHPGQGLALVSKQKEIKEGSTVNGYLYKVVALAKVDKVSGDIARCKIWYSNQEVKKGDITYDLKEVKPLCLNISCPQITVPARIVDVYGNMTEISVHDVAFIDIGVDQGVKQGSLLGIYEERKLPEEGVSIDKYQGMILILKALDNSSMGLVVEFGSVIEKGFSVKGLN